MTVERECGRRKKGKAYFTVATGPGGVPIEWFLIDPPVPVSLEEMNIRPRGVFLIEREGVHHVYDVIGEGDYPNVADFIEEAREHGISRMAKSISLDFSKITSDSRLIIIHRRALITNWQELVDAMPPEERWLARCPRMLDHKHSFFGRGPDEPCLGLVWHDLRKGVDVEPLAESESRMRVTRQLRCGVEYHGFRDLGLQTEHQYAIFGSFPLGQIEVIIDPDDETHLEMFEQASAAGISVRLVEE